MTMLGRGVYGLPGAARLANLHPRRAAKWFRSGGGRWGRGVFESDYPSVDGQHAISFLDLVELSIAGRLRAANPPVSLQRLRKIHRNLARQRGVKHPFCASEIYLGGGQIFTRPIGDEGPLMDPEVGQFVINDVLMPFLERIEYDGDTQMARLWHIADGVVVDPARNFGKPTVDRVGIATWVLASAYRGNGRDARRVADWYEIDPGDVEAAVAFEGGHAA